MAEDKKKSEIVLTENDLLFTPLQSLEHLQAWCDKWLGFTLPDCRVTDVATSTPAEFVWEIYRAVMDGVSLNILGLSGRDSSKTVALSVADLLVMIHDYRGGIHGAMTKVQATRARDYLQSYIYKIPQLKALLTKENNSLIQFKFGEHEVGLELISLTPKAVQGAHAAWVSVDELASSMDPQQIKAYKDLSGIPGTHKLNGKPAVIVKITSRQNGASLAEQEIKNAHKSGIRVVSWSTIDAMQKCTPERHGDKIVPMHINTIKGLAYTDQEFSQLTHSEQDGFTRTEETSNGCLKCPLLHYCKGKAKKQTSTSILLRSIDDVIAKVNAANSHEWVLSQLMSMQPSSEGLVYHEFKQSIHMPSFEFLWTKLTGTEPGKKVTRSMFISELQRRKAQFYAGIDFGFTHPATCVVIAVDKRENIYVVETAGAVRKDDPEWVEHIKDQIDSKYEIQAYAPDSENPSGISLLKKANLHTVEIDKGPGSVKAGVNVLKGLLKIPGTNASTRIFFLPDIVAPVKDFPGLIEEFGLYAKATDAAGQIQDDKFIKGNDHFLDGLRYILYWLYGKNLGVAVFADGQESFQNQNPFPKAEEIAKQAGVTFIDNRDEFDAQGRPKSDPDDDDPDDDGGGNGGPTFLWT